MQVRQSDISTNDLKQLARLVRKANGPDLLHYAPFFLKQRIENFMRIQNFAGTSHLIGALMNNQIFVDRFIDELEPESTEWFRDASFWTFMREWLPQYRLKQANNNPFKIWMPGCVSGNELYSLCILLHETNLLANCTITATGLSERRIEKISRGVVSKLAIESIEHNYIQSGGIRSLPDYYDSDTGLISSHLIENIAFYSQNSLLDTKPENADMIFYRNRLLYTDAYLHQLTAGIFADTLTKGGILTVGIKEWPETRRNSRLFEPINEDERIFIKRIV